jgi:hypothetical protein
MLYRRASQVRLGSEQLESRLTPAGSVAVAVTGSNIKITGDDLENDISVYVNNTPAKSTLHIVGNNGTTVTFNKPLPAGDDVGNLLIDLKKANISVANDSRGTAGVDRVQIYKISVGSLTIKGKNGGVVNADGVLARRTVIDFHVGNGISAVDPNKGPLGSDIRVLNSIVGFDGSQRPPAQKGMAILTKDSKDHVEVRYTVVSGNLVIKTQGEQDDIGLFGVFNFFDQGNYGTQNLIVDAGTGDDFLAASGNDIIKGTNIKMGDGNDKVVIGRFENWESNLFRGNVSIDLGKGDDVLGIGHTSNPDSEITNFRSKLTVKGGVGDDKLIIGNQVTGSTFNHSIDGGPQVTGDTLEVLSPLDPNDSIFKNLETRGAFVEANLTALVNEVGTKF